MRIQLFSDFTIEMEDGQVLKMDELIPRQTLTILEVLLVRYGTTVTRDELMDLFWADSDNPLSALKFAIHRLRKVLKDVPALAHIEFIQTDRGGYRFKTNVESTIDCQDLRESYRLWKRTKTIDANLLGMLEKGCAAYTGSLYILSENMYLSQESEYYRNVYLEMGDALCEYYQAQGMNDKLRECARRLCTIEPSVESNHFHYLKSLINDEEFGHAFEYYQNVYKRLTKEYEVSLSDKMLGLYEDIVQNKDKKANLSGIMDYYHNKPFEEGAFYCENAAFDYIYEINIRNALRNQARYYLLMFEIETESHDKRLGALQGKLRDTLQLALRQGDVFTRLNKYQFLVLIECPSEVVAEGIARRVSRIFKRKAQRREDGLYSTLKEVEHSAMDRYTHK